MTHEQQNTTKKKAALLLMLKGLEKELYRIKNQEATWLEKNKCRNSFACKNFNIGRTLAVQGMHRLDHLPSSVRQFYEEHTVDQESRIVYMRDPVQSSKPTWMKNLYTEHLCPLIKLIDPDWAGDHEDWVCQVNIMERGDNMPRHIDDKDLSPQIALGLGNYSGGDVMTWKDENSRPVRQSIQYSIVKLDGRYSHQAMPPETGTRFSLYFYKLFDRRWKQSVPTFFPPKVLHKWTPAAFETGEEPCERTPRSDAEEVPNSVNLTSRKRNPKNDTLKAKEKRKFKKQKQHEKQTKGASYADVAGFEKNSGPKRSCMHDAVINGASQLGVVICEKTLLKQRPPRKIKDTTLGEIQELPIIQGLLEFESMDHHLQRMKGGPVFNLFGIRNAGVYIVISTVHGRTTENHAFVYDSGFVSKEEPDCLGAIICNRTNHPVRLLDDGDRANLTSARNALDSFYGGAEVRINQVWKLKQKV